MPKENINIIQLVNASGCFNLQFRQDVKHNRPNSPTYYHWKAQFVITESPEKISLLKQVTDIFGCGAISSTKNEARYSVQNIEDIKSNILPYFKDHPLIEKKNNDFQLWASAIDIIYKNKGRTLFSWKRPDFESLIKIQEAIKKFKTKPKTQKWLSIAKDLAKTIN